MATGPQSITADFNNRLGEKRPVRMSRGSIGYCLDIVSGKPDDVVILYVDGNQIEIPVISNKDGTWSIAR